MTKTVDTRYQADRLGTSGPEIKIHRASKPVFDGMRLEEFIFV